MGGSFGKNSEQNEGSKIGLLFPPEVEPFVGSKDESGHFRFPTVTRTGRLRVEQPSAFRLATETKMQPKQYGKFTAREAKVEIDKWYPG